jgi:hypothetical protein
VGVPTLAYPYGCSVLSVHYLMPQIGWISVEQFLVAILPLEPQAMVNFHVITCLIMVYSNLFC